MWSAQGCTEQNQKFPSSVLQFANPDWKLVKINFFSLMLIFLEDERLVKTQESTFQYVIGARNSNGCDKYLSKLECEAVAKKENRIFGRDSEPSVLFPSKCYLHQDNKIYYNTDDIGGQSPKAKPICHSGKVQSHINVLVKPL